MAHVKKRTWCGSVNSAKPLCHLNQQQQFYSSAEKYLFILRFAHIDFKARDTVWRL